MSISGHQELLSRHFASRGTDPTSCSHKLTPQAGNGVFGPNFDRQNLVVGPDEEFELKSRPFITEFGVF